MTHYKFALDIRPGDTITDPDFHNGDGHVLKTELVRTLEYPAGILSVHFADGSIIEPDDLTARIAVAA